ncbi:Ribosomal-protein-alanine acetyltransferase [Lachnospiraceae bacterium TWA4]|nr:Ribosomal-protein-alanine acetyltransferase [Lachnospiraceae bacterium TWA4]
MSDDLLKLEKDIVDVDLYLKFRKSVNWKELTRPQAKKALENSLCTLCVTLAGQPIGMGRLVGDGSVICYIQDLIIHPNAQGMGVGSLLIQGFIDYVKSITEDGTEMMLDLMCAKGREEFYTKHGFIARPTDCLGPGMIMYIRK